MSFDTGSGITPIDFYFDFSSPYGYFAATRIEALAAQFKRDVAWHPIMLGAVFKTTGAMPLPMIPMKGDYSLHDFARTARFHGIDYAQPPKFPIATQSAARAMLHIHAAHGRHRATAFAQATFKAYFVAGTDISDPEQVAVIASSLGLDGAAIAEGIQTPDIKDRLKTVTEQAMARGVFGSPFCIVDGESFWGFDRFDQLRHFLQNGSL
ncbi:MAG: 2-hydroxychromene-2-carboxylate isomerase [Burkholderiaceae bacterium]